MLSLFQFAAFASKLATLAYRAKCVKSPSILLRDGSFPPILPHNPWGFHELIFYRPVSLWSDADVDDDEFLLLRALLLCSTPADLPEFAMKELEKTKLRFARTLFAYEATKLGPTKGAERFQLLLSTLNSWILLTAKHKELYVMGRYRALKRGPPESLFPAYVDPLVVELMSG
ncbi:unnamed protein product, partial [Mesorhabditis belari]|uniref:NR LBD domain-containing protein n=1 Tax=Mesorhabditis belari TaxID=2138241 RepID=A0AAF3JC25_9BILA